MKKFGQFTKGLITFLLFFESLLFSAPPQRIISLAPDLTEILYALDLGDWIVATADHSDFPKEARTIPRIGSFISPSLEKILFLKPDLILARVGATPVSLLAELKKQKIKTLSFPGKDENDIYETLQILGKTLGREKKSEVLITQMKDQIKKISRKILLRKIKPRILIQIEERPLIVAAKETLPHRIIELSGGTNVTDIFTGYPKLQLETVMKLDPDIIVILSEKPSAKNFWAPWKTLKAHKHMYALNGDTFSRATPRILLGIQALSSIIETSP